MIYEIQLEFPFATKALAKLPSWRTIEGSGVVLVKDNIFIFGGQGEAAANVTMYDIPKNQFRELAPLPYEVCDMATVKYRDKVILVGGSDDRLFRKAKSTVVSYNIETQESTELPPMEVKRFECCAVIDGNTIVVMGGADEHEGPLDSVEAFDFDTSEWSHLRSMREARKAFIAEIV
jgi:N-acetylneuraminic acid mutarotase